MNRIQSRKLRGHLLRRLPGHLGILAGIWPSHIHRDLVKAQLLFADPGHILVADGGAVQLGHGDGVQIVPLRGAVDQVGKEHGIALYTGQANAVFQ